ncbi:putative F-box protein [Cardamine amara subsp. amara]|uniref:F-box protein n=1 Tax=Cardamine amara subsp. amara TaxID=228776 RepID=A0ABD1BYX2_CARAN
MNRQKKNSVNRRKIVQRDTQSSASTYVGETLPNDLIIEIFLRLPVNSIEVCRCVSKQWSSIIRRPDFTELFLTNSLSRPLLLFTFRIGNNWHFFSSPQLQDFADNSSVEPTEYRTYSGSYHKEICQSVNGFIYLNYKRRINPRIVETIPIIYNPCTGQSITLPKVGEVGLKCFLGYDPIKKQFKVLCKEKTTKHFLSEEPSFQVLTLGTRELLWRKTESECPFSHSPREECNGICINGVLYYIAWRWFEKRLTMIIVCFDVRSEKFSFLEMKYAYYSTLIDYKGKLGVVLLFFRSGSSLSEIWVLNDAKKWSRQFFVLENPVLERLQSIWATDTGEIVWASPLTDPLFSVFYYNMERKSVRKVEIKGLRDKFQAMDAASFFTFTNHVENLMVL